MHDPDLRAGTAIALRTAAALRAEFYALPSDALVDRPTAAAALYLKAATLEKAAIVGSGPPYCRIGRRALYKKADLLAWMKRTGRTVENTAQLPTLPA